MNGVAVFPNDLKCGVCKQALRPKENSNPLNPLLGLDAMSTATADGPVTSTAFNPTSGRGLTDE